MSKSKEEIIELLAKIQLLFQALEITPLTIELSVEDFMRLLLPLIKEYDYLYIPISTSLNKHQQFKIMNLIFKCAKKEEPK